jgi:aminoglycoside phosphotransferase (APT) family kinase protein
VTLQPDDPVLAVIAPPNVDRFRALVGIGEDERISGDFTGWSKLVLLTDELAILFPRDKQRAEWLAREVDALRVIAPLGMAETPELIAVHGEQPLAAHGFVVERRLRGELLDRCVREITADQFGDVLEQVARLAARWHAAAPGPMADNPPRRDGTHAFVDELLRPGGATAVSVELTPTEVTRFEDALARIRTLEPVLVHGDLHEGQMLVDDNLQVTGILDWQSARVGHPFTEFDLGEWGTGAWRAHRPNFPSLRRRMWSAYAAARGLDAGLADDFELFWAVVHAHRWPESVWVGNEVTGTREEALAAVKNAAGRVTPAL